MPAYNEEETIKLALLRLEEHLSEFDVEYELIVVDDGSGDGTSIIVRSLMDECQYLKLVSYSENKGKGYALRSGFREAEGDIVVLMDSDLEIDPGQLEVLFGEMGDADLLIASKWHNDSTVEVPVLRRFMSRLYNLMVRFCTGMDYVDTQVGLKLMKRSSVTEIMEEATVNRFAFDVELLLLASERGLNIIESPVSLSISDSYISISDIASMFFDLLRICWRRRL